MATASTVLEVVIKAKDEASSTIKGLQKDFGGLGGALASTAKIAAGALVAAGGAAIAFGVVSVKAYAESEAKMAVMNNTLKNLGGNVADNTKKILAAANATKKLGFDDDDAAQSITNLFVKTKDLTKATELNTIAMDLARYKHIALEDASKLVSQAMSGNAKVFKEFGIQLDETKDPLDALRDAHKAFAGSAQASAGTLEVVTERIKNAYGDIQKAVGKVLSKEATSVLSFVADKLAQISEIDFQGYFDAATKRIKALFELIDEKSGLLESFKNVWMTVVDAFNTFVKPAFDDMMETIMENKELLAELFGNFLKFAGWLIAGGLLAAIGLLVTAMEGIKVIIIGLKATVNGLADAFIYVEDKAIKAYEALKKYYDLAAQKASGVVSSVKGFFSGKAGGGTVMGRNSYLVGENGPEIFTPSMSGNITPNHALSGGGGLVININGGTYLSEDVAKKIGDMIVQQFRRQGRI